MAILRKFPVITFVFCVVALQCLPSNASIWGHFFHKRQNNIEFKNGAYGINADKEEKGIFDTYMRNLNRKIKLNWIPPKEKETMRAITYFKLDKKGDIVSSKIQKSSGCPEYDTAALDSIYAAAPFDKLPRAYKDNFIDINFTFDYNVFDYNSQNKMIRDAVQTKYAEAFISKVKDNWVIPASKKAVKTIIKLKLGFDGSIVEAKVVDSSGIAEYDMVALNSIAKSTPYIPPKMIKRTRLRIIMTFDYELNKVDYKLF